MAEIPELPAQFLKLTDDWDRNMDSFNGPKHLTRWAWWKSDKLKVGLVYGHPDNKRVGQSYKTGPGEWVIFKSIKTFHDERIGTISSANPDDVVASYIALLLEGKL